MKFTINQTAYILNKKPYFFIINLNGVKFVKILECRYILTVNIQEFSNNIMDKILGYQPVFTKGVVSNANCYTYISGSKNYIFIFFIFYFFYLWWILSYIEMKQPRVYMCSPSQSPLPPPSPPIPSKFSQCTRSKRLSHASNLGWWSVSP